MTKSILRSGKMQHEIANFFTKFTQADLAEFIMTKKYDIVIIGAGHNGLIAATYLAKAGKKVLVLEANNEAGGATTSVKVFPDFDARLTRYSYLVPLLPDKIVKYPTMGN